MKKNAIDEEIPEGTAYTKGRYCFRRLLFLFYMCIRVYLCVVGLLYMHMYLYVSTEFCKTVQTVHSKVRVKGK